MNAYLLNEGNSDDEVKQLAASRCDEIWPTYKVVHTSITYASRPKSADGSKTKSV